MKLVKRGGDEINETINNNKSDSKLLTYDSNEVKTAVL